MCCNLVTTQVMLVIIRPVAAIVMTHVCLVVAVARSIYHQLIEVRCGPQRWTKPLLIHALILVDLQRKWAKFIDSSHHAYSTQNKNSALKLKFRKYPSIHTNYIISHCTSLQYNHNIWHGTSKGRNEFVNAKDNELNSAAISLLWHPPAMLCRHTATVGNVKIAVWKDRIIVASTCRRSVQFGCYITWLWMAHCASLMTKIHLFN